MRQPEIQAAIVCLKWFIEDKSMCNLNVHCYLPVYTNSQNKCVNQMYTMHQQTDQCILETIFQYLETILNLIDSLFVIKINIQISDFLSFLKS